MAADAVGSRRHQRHHEHICPQRVPPASAYGVPRLLITGGFGLLVVLLALWRSALPITSFGDRARLAFIILLGLLPVSFNAHSHYWAFHDYPWPVVIPLIILLVAGGWYCRQKWLSILLLGLVGLFLVIALPPPAYQQLPVSRTVGDLTIAINSLGIGEQVRACDFTVRTQLQGGVKRNYSIEDIRVTGAVRQVLGFRCWQAHEIVLDDTEELQSVRMSSWTFPPSWARSIDLRISIPRWPDQPVETLTVAIPARGTPPDRLRHTADGPTNLTIAGLGWINGQTGWAQAECLNFTLSYIRSPFGTEYGDIRVRLSDQHGTILRTAGRGGGQYGDLASGDYELLDFPEGLTHIQFEAFSAAELEAHRLTFEFRGLPNR